MRKSDIMNLKSIAYYSGFSGLGLVKCSPGWATGYAGTDGEGCNYNGIQWKAF